MNLHKFKKTLEDNPRFQYGTIRVYMTAINELIENYGEDPTIEQLNEFIAIKCKKRQPTAKYAIKEYLKFLGREEDYTKLVEAKVREPIREKHFLSKENLIAVVESIDNPLHQVIARIQAATGTRASEVISIEKKRIKKEHYEEDGKTKTRIKITIKGKGDKPRPIYLMEDSWAMIEPYYIKSKGYIFLKDADSLTEQEAWKKTVTAYKRYLESLQKAANKCGFTITSHDLRRSVANLIGEIRQAQLVLGHSDMKTTEKYLKDDSQKVSNIMLHFQEELQDR